jgi:hypothetical protein
MDLGLEYTTDMKQSSMQNDGSTKKDYVETIRNQLIVRNFFFYFAE